MISMFNTGYDLQNQLDGVKNGIAIVATNNTHIAITSGQYVYIQDNSTLAEGLYRATANIAANGTLSGSNVTAVSGGGLNALNSKIDSFISVNVTGSYNTLVEACQQFLDLMGSNMHGAGNLPFGGYRYDVVCYKNSNSWATMGLFGYNGAAYHCWKENGTWKTERLAVDSNISITPLGSTEGIKTVALDDTRCPVNQVRWFNLRNSDTSELPGDGQKYSVARVTKRTSGTCHIEVYADDGGVWMCGNTGAAWTSWENFVFSSKFAPTYQALTLNTDYTSGGYCRYLRSGNVITIVLDTTFKSGLASLGTDIVASGVPWPIYGTVVFNLINGSGEGARLIVENGKIRTNYGKIPNAEFYSGTVTYICS